MRARYWFLVFLFVVGSGLFFVGLYLMYWSGESGWGFPLLIAGVVLLLVLLMIGVFYAARVRVKILRDAHEF